ncbi:MAG: zinc ribbon domain-containing protein [Eubacterium sp.]|nr:zinc ribbon domain-containing protein [Eubacterium sp.]
MFCSNCGNQIDENSKFCQFCGFKIISFVPQQQQGQMSYAEPFMRNEENRIKSIEFNDVKSADAWLCSRNNIEIIRMQTSTGSRGIVFDNYKKLGRVLFEYVEKDYYVGCFRFAEFFMEEMSSMPIEEKFLKKWNRKHPNCEPLRWTRCTFPRRTDSFITKTMYYVIYRVR